MNPMPLAEAKRAYRAPSTVPQTGVSAIVERGSGQLERTTGDLGGPGHHENLTKFSARAKREQKSSDSRAHVDRVGTALLSLSDLTPEYRARLERRFWAKVSPEPMSGCHLWTGALNRSGYGTLAVGCWSRSNPKNRVAHRVAWLLDRDATEGMVLDHLCRNPACVNPRHLEEVTVAENNRRGRVAREVSP